MEINKKVKTTKTESIRVDVLCNKCGKTCNNSKRNGHKNSLVDYQGLIEAEVHGGYDSEKIGDLISWKFSICEFCLDKIVASFKIPAQIRDHDIGSEYLDPKEMEKRRKVAAKRNQNEWITAIIEKTKAAKKPTKNLKKELSKKNTYELYDIFHSL